MTKSLGKLPTLILPVLLAALGMLLLPGCTGNGDKSFHSGDHPFSFSYPAKWTLTRAAADAPGESLHTLTVALDEPYDQVTVVEHRMKKQLPPGANGFQPEIDRIVKRLAKQVGGTAGNAREVRFGEVPGYQYEVTYPAPDGKRLQSTMTFLFKGDREFQITCQSTPQRREAVEQGCDKILESIKFD